MAILPAEEFSTARRLIAVRGLRSLGQGALMVDFVLYARTLGWSPQFLGTVLASGLLFAAIATSLAGPASDRLGRRPFIVGYEALALSGALLAAVSAARPVVVFAAVIAGYGRGTVGNPGFFGVVEQAWLARSAPRQELSRLFSRNTAVGFFGTALGAILGVLPQIWARLLPGALAYRPLFLFAALSEAVCLFLILRTNDPRTLASGTPQEEGDGRLKPEERRSLARLAFVNALNGLGMGLSGPLVVWWFAERYGVGPAAIGPAIAATLAFSGLSALAAGKAGAHFGAIRLVVAMRAAGLFLLALLPFLPSYPLAISCYALRTILNRGTAGSRQALALGLVPPQKRGLAASVNSFSMQLPRVFGPLFAGLFFAAGSFAPPFLLAALFQGAYLVLYSRVFAREGRARLLPPEEGG